MTGGAPVQAGGPDAAIKGVFGAAVTTPIIALHAVLLPDGRVLSYGTDETGRQGARLVYDVWDPSLGTDAAAHLVLPNTTSTDIFCSGASVLAVDGRVLITGGDRTINGKRNYSNRKSEIFDPTADTVRANSQMAYLRWYPSLVALASGRVAVLGGRQDPSNKGASTPEIFEPGSGWRKLSGATSETAYGSVQSAWFYPKGFQAPNGNVFVLTPQGKMFDLDVAGQGTLTELGPTTFASSPYLPTLMFAPGRVLSVRGNRRAVVVDLNGSTPAVARTADVSQKRLWSNTTVLADGKVLLNGGSAELNKLVGVANHVEIWDPATGTWTTGAHAAKPRLYHSTALLLPDGSVLTAGGGAPGPVKNLNAEIYYPPYLYANDGPGTPAHRPAIVSAPSELRFGRPFSVTVASGNTIARATLVRTGSVTHTFNPDQRFLELAITQSGDEVAVQAPSDPNVAVPGYYLLFLINTAGTPSVAQIVRVVG